MAVGFWLHFWAVCAVCVWILDVISAVGAGVASAQVVQASLCVSRYCSGTTVREEISDY